jgi:hypothetical protein
MTSEHSQPLRELLHRRVHIIADHDLRAHYPEQQLAALQEVSEQLQEWHQQHRTALPARLNHFMDQASFSKALEYLDQTEA